MEPDYRIVTENRGKQILDFSVNTNPLGVPPKMVQNASDFISSFGFYPDPECLYPGTMGWNREGINNAKRSL